MTTLLAHRTALATLASMLTAPALAADPIVGTWQATVQPVNCSTGDRLGEPFSNMTVFHHGGTLGETNTSDPTSRGPAFGSWRHDGRAYVGRFDFLRFQGGQPIGSTSVSFRRLLGPDGNTSWGTAEFSLRSPDGTVLFSGCSTFSSVRLR